MKDSNRATSNHQHRAAVSFTRYSLFENTETRKAQVLLTYYENKCGVANTYISGSAHHE